MQAMQTVLAMQGGKPISISSPLPPPKTKRPRNALLHSG